MAILIVNQISGKYVTLQSESQSKERFLGNHLTSELKKWQRRGLDISLLTHLFSLLNTQAWTPGLGQYSPAPLLRLSLKLFIPSAREVLISK